MTELRKFRDLDAKEQREVANKLTQEMLSWFGRPYYLEQEQLQEEFESFAAMDHYITVVTRFQEKWQVDVGPLLKAKRWKLCQVCYKPFLAYDRGNRGTACQRNTYRRYTMTGQTVNQEGRSECQNTLNKQRTNKSAAKRN